MSLSSPSVAPAIVADIPPPIVPHAPIAGMLFLIFLAIGAAACVGLRKLFRRRVKDPIPSLEGVTKK